MSATSAFQASESESRLVDPSEIARFNALAAEWWNPNGPMKPLHRINPVRLSYLKDEFAKRNVKVIGLSVDPIEDHRGWAGDIEETQGVPLNFPLIADPDHKVSDLYDMIHPNANDTLTVRSVFIIGDDDKVKLILTYPASTGRNFDEILRVIDSLQLTANHKVATPANWTEGGEVIISPAIPNDEAKSIYPDGWREEKPYLRYVPQPG